MVAPWQTHRDADPKYPIGIRSHMLHQALIPTLRNAGSVSRHQPIMMLDPMANPQCRKPVRTSIPTTPLGMPGRAALAPENTAQAAISTPPSPDREFVDLPYRNPLDLGAEPTRLPEERKTGGAWK